MEHIVDGILMYGTDIPKSNFKDRNVDIAPTLLYALNAEILLIWTEQ